MDILTPLQKEFIRKFAQSSFQKTFYLTGGTALAAFYLQHRLSEDLDFFTDDAAEVRQVAAWIQKLAGELGLQLQIRRQAESFLGCFLESRSGGEILKVDFALDAPFRLAPTELQNEYGIFIDNLVDISCNKLSALYDRAEAKDFVDLYFLDQDFQPFNDMVKRAKTKHVGLDDYWLAQALARVEVVQKWPRIIKDVDLATLKNFFMSKAKEFIKA